MPVNGSLLPLNICDDDGVTYCSEVREIGEQEVLDAASLWNVRYVNVLGGASCIFGHVQRWHARETPHVYTCS